MSTTKILQQRPCILVESLYIDFLQFFSDRYKLKVKENDLKNYYRKMYVIFDIFLEEK